MKLSSNKIFIQENEHIFTTEISPRTEQALTAEYWKEMIVKQAHLILGYVNRLQTIETAKKCGWKIKT
jgi:hypothetical protein